MAATRWRPPDAVRRGTGTRRVSAGAGLGWPAELGQKRGGNSRRKGKAFFIFIFKCTAAQNPILNPRNSFSKSDSKTKFVLNFEIFNFAKRSQVKIPIYF
jgi:hypothetical protein